MKHTIELSRTPQDFYKDGSGQYSYQGEFITFKIDNFYNEDLVEEILKEIDKFKKLCTRNTGIYIQKEVRVDWATFAYFVKTYNLTVLRPNSCFYATFEFVNRRCSLSLTSPTINFDYNIFKQGNYESKKETR